MKPERFSSEKQRECLERLALTVEFLSTNDGSAFMQQLEHHLAPWALAELRKLGVGSAWVEPADVVNTALLRLIEQGGRVARYAAEARDEPWGYLAVCMVGWVREQVGTLGLPLEEEIVTSAAADRHDHQLSSLEEVISHTFRVLRLYTPRSYQRSVLRLLTWLAENPPQRLSYEAADCAAASVRFTQLSYSQISAVMNVVWGGRPKRRDTSLFAAFLLNENFRPSDSPTHTRALVRYRRAFARGASNFSLMQLLLAQNTS